MILFRLVENFSFGLKVRTMTQILYVAVLKSTRFTLGFSKVVDVDNKGVFYKNWVKRI
jgi:hypothetical protein